MKFEETFEVVVIVESELEEMVSEDMVAMGLDPDIKEDVEQYWKDRL
jgi:hypothetical protein